MNANLSTLSYLFFILDYNECLDEKTNDCDQNAICKNTVGSFECFCKVGYAGNGKTCQGKEDKQIEKQADNRETDRQIEIYMYLFLLRY